MNIQWDVPIEMDDGLVLRADVFRPEVEGKYPAILSYGAYGKGLAFQDGYKTAWEIMARENPDALAGSSNRYQNWEVVDPEKWVPDGYALIRVDSRGAGRSPGYLAHNNARETKDICLCVEWAAAQPWCSGKVGMNGISYYASNQWRAAAARPPHLAAICAWEGWNDAYRESARHGGIICSFRKNGQDLQTRGNFEGFVRSASKDKWLEVHGGSHWAPFYTDYGVALQKRFFGYFLKGEKNGWDKQPRVLLNVRHPCEKFEQR